MAFVYVPNGKNMAEWTPTATGADQLTPTADGDLTIPDDLRWIADFDRAVEVGMGLKVPLTAATAPAERSAPDMTDASFSMVPSEVSTLPVPALK